MSSLKDEIRAILDDAAARIHAAILNQLGAASPNSAHGGGGGARPARAAGGAGARGGRARVTAENRAEMVKQFLKVVRAAGDEGASRQRIMSELGWNEGTFNRTKQLAQHDIRMKGTRRTATYHAK